MNAEEALLQRIAELEKTVSALSKPNEEYKALVASKDLKDAKPEYKDRLFKFIFGNPENKQWTLSLYTAVNGTSYTNPCRRPVQHDRRRGVYADEERYFLHCGV